MEKPVILSAWLGDTLSLRVALHDDSGAAFDSASWQIDAVQLCIPALDAVTRGTIAANLASVLVPADTFQTPGDYPFYLQILSSATGAVFTPTTGTFKLLDLPA